MNSIKIEEILQSFYEISGMDVAIVNSKNKIIARRYSGATYCTNIHKSQKCMDICLESDKCELARAYEKKGLHMYKCPSLLTYLSVWVLRIMMPVPKSLCVLRSILLRISIKNSLKKV